MGDYFRHWINMQRKLSETPRIFHVNWFRKQGREVHVAGPFPKTCASSVDRRPRPRRRPREGTPIGWCRATRHRLVRARFPEAKFEELSLRPVAWRARSLGHEEPFIDLHAACRRR